MKKLIDKNLLIYLVTLSAMLFSQAGCENAGLVGLLGTPTNEEIIIPAEYDLTKQIDKKILVLVEQPEWLNSQVNLRYNLTNAIRQEIMTKTKLNPKNLITYEKLVEFRSLHTDFSSLSPADIGRTMDANMVLLIVVEDYQLKEMAESGYVAGKLNTHAALYDTKTGAKLWPLNEDSKNIEVGFEVETRGILVGISHLATTSAFCTTRYFYDCSKAKFTIAEDRTRQGNEIMENWK